MLRYLTKGKVDGGGRAVTNGKDDKVLVSPESDDQESENENDSDSDNQEKSDEDGEVRYIVERIDDKRVDDGVTYYYIKWKDWDVSSNTWEPLENLDDCEDLLADFEKRYAEGKIPLRRKKGGGRKRKSGAAAVAIGKRDDDEDETQSVKSNMKTYRVMDEWCAKMEPLSVEGVIQVDRELTYIVKQNTRGGGPTSQLDRTNAVLVKAANFRQLFPELVIDYYQSRVIWGAGNANEEESKEQIDVAMQMKKLCKLDDKDDENEKVITGIPQKDNTTKTEEEYAEFPEDLEETDLSSGMNSVDDSFNDLELGSELWKQFLENDDDW